MQWMDFTLNQITLLALSLVAGVLVDDAIVEIENIVRHMRMGKSGYQAALDAADEIGLAVVATSSTIIAVFLPVSFMGGITGQYFKQFGLTVAAAVFFSLHGGAADHAGARGLCAAQRLDRRCHQHDGPLMTLYMAAAALVRRESLEDHRRGVVFVVIAVDVAFIWHHSADLRAARGFRQRAADIELPPGGTLEDTSRVSAAAAAVLRKSPEVTDIVEFVGQTDGRDPQRRHLS